MAEPAERRATYENLLVACQLTIDVYSRLRLIQKSRSYR